MLKFFVKVLGLIAALALSSAAGAVGMGGINVMTALGEPLKAEVELVAVGKADKNKMTARLASSEAYKKAGLDYPAALPKLQFQVEERANGGTYLTMSSAQPVNEPFVSLLLELTWPSGSLLREYTFLLDPPGFKPEQPKAEEVKPVLSKVEEPLQPSAVSAGESKVSEPKAGEPKADEPKASEPKVEAVKKEPTPMQAAAPMDEKAAAPVESVSAKKPAESANVVSGSVKVKRGDSLSKIAREIKSPDVSLERMLVAMYRANENEFDGKNMNRLRTGKILRVPEGDDLNQVAQGEAVKEIHAQAADWHAYRLKLAAASDSLAEQAPKQEASGKISATVADKAPPAKESAREVVRLSKGEAPGDAATAGGNAKAMQDKLHALEEEATARSKALKESNERIAILEKNIKELQHLIELKGQPVPSTPVPAKPEETPVDVKPLNKLAPPKIEVQPLDAAPVSGVSVSAVAPASAVKPAKPIAPKIETPPPSLLDEILAEPLYLAGGAAVLLGLGGLGFMRTRRRTKDDKNKEQTGNADTHIAAPVASSPDTGDFTNIATDTVTSAGADDVDPISEADLFLNFGRDKQAEEILKDALKKDPDNQQIRLKLLSIYANRKDTGTFADVAGEVRDSGNAAAWAQAAEMGRKLDPGNPLYGGEGTPGATELPQDEAGNVQSPASLDFDLGSDAESDTAESSAPVDVPLEAASVAPAELDLDIGLDAAAEAAPAVTEPESTVTPDEPPVEKADTAPAMDFDLEFEVPTEAEAAVPSTADSENNPAPDEALNEDAKAPENLQAEQEIPLEFDIAPPEQAAMKEEEEAPTKAEEAMEFTLDFPAKEESSPDDQEAPVSAPATKEADTLDLSDINLNLDVPAPAPAAPAEEVKDAHWHDVATKLDLARAYQEMGDASGAREILEEVLKEGDAQQRAAAEVMMQQLSA